MKAILKTGEEFQVNSVFMKTDSQLCISLKGILSYDAIRAKLTTSATEVIKVYVSDTDFSVYEGFSTLIYPSTVTQANDGTFDVAVILEKENDLVKRVTLMETAFNELILG
jgi:hypothetical protein